MEGDDFKISQEHYVALCKTIEQVKKEDMASKNFELCKHAGSVAGPHDCSYCILGRFENFACTNAYLSPYFYAIHEDEEGNWILYKWILYDILYALMKTVIVEKKISKQDRGR